MMWGRRLVLFALIAAAPCCSLAVSKSDYVGGARDASVGSNDASPGADGSLLDDGGDAAPIERCPPGTVQFTDSFDEPARNDNPRGLWTSEEKSTGTIDVVDGAIHFVVPPLSNGTAPVNNRLKKELDGGSGHFCASFWLTVPTAALLGPSTGYGTDGMIELAYVKAIEPGDAAEPPADYHGISVGERGLTRYWIHAPENTLVREDLLAPSTRFHVVIDVDYTNRRARYAIDGVSIYADNIYPPSAGTPTSFLFILGVSQGKTAPAFEITYDDVTLVTYP
jgi:hypothetical protein